MGILDWWRQRSGSAAGSQDGKRIDEAVERVVQTTNPRLKFARRYRARLAPAVRDSLDYIRDLLASLPPPREASAAGWAADPCIGAFFSSPTVLAQAFSRSTDLRAHFDKNPNDTEAYAVLGMAMTEKRVLGMALQGATVQRDVPQTVVSFDDHRVRICGHTEADLKAEIERRLFDQMALAGLARVAEEQSRRKQLEQESALLKARKRLLEREGAGMGAALSGDSVEPSELARLQAQFDENTKQLTSLGVTGQLLDRELECIREVLAEPAEHLYVSRKRLRLDRTNVVLEGGTAAAGNDLEIWIARVPGNPPLLRAFAVVRFPRAELLPVGRLIDDASRLLG
jgi:hypothetical protein